MHYRSRHTKKKKKIKNRAQHRAHPPSPPPPRRDVDREPETSRSVHATQRSCRTATKQALLSQERNNKTPEASRCPSTQTHTNMNVQPIMTVDGVRMDMRKGAGKENKQTNKPIKPKETNREIKLGSSMLWQKQVSSARAATVTSSPLLPCS